MKNVLGKLIKAILPPGLMVLTGIIISELNITSPELKQAIHVIARAVSNAIGAY